MKCGEEIHRVLLSPISQFHKPHAYSCRKKHHISSFTIPCKEEKENKYGFRLGKSLCCLRRRRFAAHASSILWIGNENDPVPQVASSQNQTVPPFPLAAPSSLDPSFSTLPFTALALLSPLLFPSDLFGDGDSGNMCSTPKGG